MTCNNCKKHEETETWVGEGGMLAFTHGFSSQWCKCCVLKAQIKHIEKIAKGLESIKKKLKGVKCK